MPPRPAFNPDDESLSALFGQILLHDPKQQERAAKIFDLIMEHIERTVTVGDSRAIDKYAGPMMTAMFKGMPTAGREKESTDKREAFDRMMAMMRGAA